MENSGGNEAHTNGAGQSVNVVVSHGSVFWIVVGIIALIVVLCLTNKTSVSAELKANQAIKASEDMQTEFRITQVWAQRVNSSCEHAGVANTSIPASLSN